MKQTVKCPICKEPYEFYSHMAGDQSACPDCRGKAAEKMNRGKSLRDRIRGISNG